MKTNLRFLILDMFEYSYNRMKNIFVSEGPEMLKTNQEIAKEIFQGKWGNESERRRRLTEAGYNYDAIQSIVNAISESLTPEQIKQACEDYDKNVGATKIEITGTETLEIEIDLSKYKGINITFINGTPDV